MGIFKRLVTLLGLARDGGYDQHDGSAAIPVSSSVPPAAAATGPRIPRKGFSVPVQVPVDRSPSTPLLTFCPAGDGGIQGLRWYARRLRMDEDGDIADEFLDEASPDTLANMEETDRPLPRFKVKYNTRPAKVKNLDVIANGKIQHLVEYQDRLEWM